MLARSTGRLSGRRSHRVRSNRCRVEQEPEQVAALQALQAETSPATRIEHGWPRSPPDCGLRGAPTGRRRRRDVRRGGRPLAFRRSGSDRKSPLACRSCARSGGGEVNWRSHSSPAALAERLLHPRSRHDSIEGTVVGDETRARDEICEVGLSLFSRGLTFGSTGTSALAFPRAAR